MIDSHAHLDMEAFEKDREDVIRRAIEGGLKGIVTVGIHLESSKQALDLARSHSIVHAAVGCHPHEADGCTDDALDGLAQLVSEPEVVAWGEIGLDYYRMYASREAQERIFRRQIRMARDLDLPIIVHDREAHEAVLQELQALGTGRGVIHCFSGDYALAEEFLKLGYHISIPGTVTYKGAKMLKNVAGKIPLESLLIETDCPFLTPAQGKGKRNEPLFVSYTAREIARIRGLETDQVAVQTAHNAAELFHLEE